MPVANVSGASKKRPSIPAGTAKPPRAPAKKIPAKQVPAKQVPGKKVPAKKIPAKKIAATKIPAKKIAATKIAAKKIPARKAPARKAPARTTAAKQAAAKTTPATTTPARTTRPDRTSTAVKSTAPKSPTLDKFLGGQRQALLDERVNYARQAESLRAEADELAAEREPGDVQFDEESGEGDTLAVERERDLALSAQALDAIDAIDRSLAKIDNGTYGICDQCGAAIPKERLRALPHAALCVRCKSGGLGRR